MSSEIIKIEGELVTFYTESVKKRVSLKEMLPFLERRMPVTIPNLPRSAVAVHYDETNPASRKIFFLCEIAPGTRTIRKSRGGVTKAYKLAMPWSYFFFGAVGRNETMYALNTYNLFMSPKQFENADSPLYPALIPNVYRDGRICFGYAGAPAGFSLDKQIDFLVNTFYDSPFNADLDGDTFYPFEASNFGPWVRASETDPLAWMKFPEWEGRFKNHAKTFKQLLGTNVLEDRSAPLSISTEIPPLAMPFTFGRAAEWLDGLTPENRTRLQAAFNLHAAEVTDFTVAPTAAVTDDGGIVV